MFNSKVLTHSMAVLLLSSASISLYAKPLMVADVNGSQITQKDLSDFALEQYKVHYEDLPISQKKQILDAIVNRVVLAKEAKKQGIDKQATTIAKIKSITESILASEVLAKTKDGLDISEKSIKEFYKNNTANMKKKKYKARHILIEDEKEAQTVYQTVSKDTKKFAATAMEKSKDKGSAINGGNLGWFDPAQMVPEFANAVKDAKKGVVSKPVKSQFGYHVILVEDSKDIEPPSYEDSKDNIKKFLTNEKMLEEINKLKKQYQIKFEMKNL